MNRIQSDNLYYQIKGCQTMATNNSLQRESIFDKDDFVIETKGPH